MELKEDMVRTFDEKRMTPLEMQIIREKNLCYTCDEKFTQTTYTQISICFCFKFMTLKTKQSI